MRPRRRQALFSAGLLIFLAFCLSVLAAVRTVPRELHLLPGETGRLRVGFPLSLFVSEKGRSFLAGPVTQGSELIFRAAATGVFSVELKLLGALPLGRVAVRIVEQRKVVAGGQAIGVLLSAEGLVVVGHRPLRAVDGVQRYPAREAGIEVGDVLLRADGEAIAHADDLARLVERAAAEGRPLRLSLRRAGRFLEKQIEPVICRWPENGEGSPRAMLGLFVEDPAAGVGT
ncbi:MAG: PDZ domain-containing protein, partial [Firmicutes bacterium]|nr:PDZ domain-containing protein [Bacillota bacterium]